jgi:hypothetical protein
MWQIWILTKPGEPNPSFGIAGQTVEAGLANAGLAPDLSIDRIRKALQIPDSAEIQRIPIEPRGTPPREQETVFCSRTFRYGTVLVLSSDGKHCNVKWKSGPATTEVTLSLYVYRRPESEKLQPYHLDADFHTAMTAAIEQIHRVPGEKFPARPRILDIMTALRGYLTEQGTTVEQDCLLRHIGVTPEIR